MAICIGCGLKVNSSTGLLEVELRPGGGIACDPDGSDAGLYLSGASTTGSNCIDVASGVVSINPSEDACNGIQCRANGLYAPKPDSLTGINNSGSTQAAPVGVNGTEAPGGNVYTFNATNTLSITNTLCCNVFGLVRITAGGLKMGTAGPGLLIEGFLEISTDGGAYIGANPGGSKVIHNNSTTAQLWGDFNNIVDNLWRAPLAPSAITTYHARMRYVVTSGSATSGTLIGAQAFEYDYIFTQTGC